MNPKITITLELPKWPYSDEELESHYDRIAEEIRQKFAGIVDLVEVEYED